MTYLIGIIIALIGTTYHFFVKSKSEEVLLNNSKQSDSYNKAVQDTSKNQGLLESEEEKRKQLQSDLETKEKDEPTQKDMLDYFNSTHTD